MGKMKLATWNVNSIRVRLDVLAAWLERQQPDVVCLQETKVVDELFPAERLAEIGYHSVFAGERTYNGVAILSREPLTAVRVEFPLPENADRRLISGVCRGLRVYSAYFPNGRDPLSEHFQTKLRWIDGLGDLLFGPGGAATQEAVALLGDFNVAPESRDVYDPMAMQGRLLYHPDERAALRRLLERGLVDAFRVCRPETGLYSWWDYRQGAFRRNLGLRIDHIWTSSLLEGRVKGASIDREERRGPSTSDHAPVMVELEL